MRPKRILSCSIAALLTLNAGAATVGTFDDILNDTPGILQKSGDANNSGPTIETGGPTGSFVRLTHGQGGQFNSYVFDASDAGNNGNWSTLTGQFDFRFTNSDGNPADGLGFLFLPVSRSGISGNGLTDFAAEEPNTADTLAIGLDMYTHGNTNDISLHANRGEAVSAYTAPELLDYMNSGWNRAKVTFTQVGNGMNAVVEVTKDVHGAPTTFTRIESAVDARPYAYRMQVSARTGGAVMTTDVDNVIADHSGNASTTLPTINPGKYAHQDFDSLGASAYTARLHNPDGLTLRPGPKLIGSGGSGGGAYLQLVADGQNSTLASVAMTRTADGGLAPTRHVEVDFRMANPDGVTPADGMGILLLPTNQYGVVGGGAAPSFENPGLTDTLGIGLQVYNGARANIVHLRYNDQDFPVTVDQGTLDLLDGAWHRVKIETEAASGGTNVSLSFTRDVNGAAIDVPIFANQFVPGMVPYDYRVQVGARTGGLNIQADVDNIRTFAKPGSYVETNRTTLQNFDEPGTFYQATDRHGFDGGTDANRHAAILAGGPSGNFLRLVHAVNGQNTNIGFNQVIPSGVPKPVVQADFDFRMQSDAGINRADGFAFGLFDVNTYGASGSIIDGQLSWEGQGLANALTLAFGIYDGNDQTTTDFLRLIYNGAEIEIFAGGSDVFPAFDLNTDLFHHAKLTLTDVGTDTSASLTLTQDIFGAPAAFSIFSDIIIPGLDMDTFDFRAGFGARTGGANADIDVDNLVVIPEPASAMLLLGGLALVGGCRRRRNC